MNKVFMFVNVDWFFLSHRLPIARAASQKGIKMHVYAEYTKSHCEDNYSGFNLYNSPIKRTFTGLFTSCKEFFNTFVLIKKEKPSVVHAVTIKPIILLGFVCFILRIPFIGSISGLGPAFQPINLRGRLKLYIIKFLYKIIFLPDKSMAICQSKFDASVLINNGLISSKKVSLVMGSGVDLEEFYSKKNAKGGKLNVLMASRLLKDKGVIEFCISAGEIIREHKFNVTFALAGPLDLDSPSALKESEVIKICELHNIKFLGHRNDMQNQLAKTDIFVMPSYYAEGIPKVLLEAAASNCAVITTDHPGCRDAIIPNKTGILVKPKSIPSLKDAFKMLLSDSERIHSMGIEGQKLAKEKFSVEKVINLHYSLYGSFINEDSNNEK